MLGFDSLYEEEWGCGAAPLNPKPKQLKQLEIMEIKPMNKGELISAYIKGASKGLNSGQTKLAYVLYREANRQRALEEYGYTAYGFSADRRDFLESEVTPRQFMVIECFYHRIIEELEQYIPSSLNAKDNVSFIEDEYFVVDANEVLDYAYSDFQEKKGARPLVALRADIKEINEVKALWAGDDETYVYIFPFQLIKDGGDHYLVLPIVNFLKFYLG